MSGKDGKRGKKRPKSYYLKCAHKKVRRIHDLDAGMCGFLVTCNMHEREAVREMYNILNEYADTKLGPEKVNKAESNSDDDSEEDMEKAMAKEITEMKTVATQERRFQNTDTKSKNCIFIRTTLEDPCSIAHDIFTEIVEKQQNKVRYAIRMIPVAATCKTNMKDIERTAQTVFQPHFETPHGVGLKFTSVCKIRNNASLSRMTLLPALSNIIREMNPLHTLNHDEPDLVVVVEIIRNICCLSVVKDYFTFRKYNFHEAVKPRGTEESNVGTENSTNVDTENSKSDPTSTDELTQSRVEDKDVAKIDSSDQNPEKAVEGIDETVVSTDLTVVSTDLTGDNENSDEKSGLKTEGTSTTTEDLTQDLVDKTSSNENVVNVDSVKSVPQICEDAQDLVDKTSSNENVVNVDSVKSVPQICEDGQQKEDIADKTE